MALPAVKLRKDLARSLRRGHPWVFREALAPVGGIENGALVEVHGKDGRRLALGFWDAESPIAVRVLTLEPRFDRESALRERLARALAVRLERLELERTNAFRWVHGEADGLPGVHVDLYADVAAVRFDGGGARAFYRDLAKWLRGTERLRVRDVVDREHRESAPRLEVREHGLRFAVDLAHGQKGGLFLDQRENRAEVGRRAPGQRVLNLFGYTGGFSIYAAAGGAERTDTVDIAAPALAAARTNFELNRLPLPNAGFHAVDAFEFLTAAARRGERWDLVVSDPPSFAKSRRTLVSGLAAYRRLHELAVRVLAPGGLFCPASCSSQVSSREFLKSVADGARAAGRQFELEELRGPGFDHPALPAFPEGDYLKFAIGVVP